MDSYCKITLENNPNEFDKSLIPEEYPHFRSKTVNQYTYDKLRGELNKIKESFAAQLGSTDPEDDSPYYYLNNDWESELCYQQGRYMEFVSWNDEVPPFYQEPMDVANVTYRKLTRGQLAFYLYWRTEFKKGHYVRGYRCCYYLFLYEIEMGIGNFTPYQTMKYLNALKTNCIKGMRIKSAIEKIEAKYSFISEEDELFSKPCSKWNKEWEFVKNAIVKGDYTYLYEFINHSSEFRLSRRNNPGSQYKCKNDILNCLKQIIPKLIVLFFEHGLVFYDFFIGKSDEPLNLCMTTANTEKRVGLKYKDQDFVFNRVSMQTYLVDVLETQQKFVRAYTRFYPDEILYKFLVRKTEVEVLRNLNITDIEIEIPTIHKEKFANKEIHTVEPIDIDEREKIRDYYSLYPEIARIIETTVSDVLRD